MWKPLTKRCKPKMGEKVFITGIGRKSGKRWFEVAIFDGDEFLDTHDSSYYVTPSHWAQCEDPK